LAPVRRRQCARDLPSRGRRARRRNCTHREHHNRNPSPDRPSHEKNVSGNRRVY
jgi:hypothetical protein